MNIPNDPVMLLSYVNTQLRDFFSNLDDMCSSLQISKEMLVEKMADIDYEYDANSNQFV